MIAQVIGDGNCFYKALSLYLTNNEVNTKIKEKLDIMLLLKIMNL